MCGIAGIFHRNGAPVDSELLIRMTRKLIHRGPDEEGYFINSSNRLSADHDGLRFSNLPIGKGTGNWAWASAFEHH